MRLTPYQVQTIKNTVDRVLGVPNKVWLFGSRADDSQRGGDIDLFIETQAMLPNRVATACRLAGELQMRLGDQKIDVIIIAPETREQPIHQIARQTGVML